FKTSVITTVWDRSGRMLSAGQEELGFILPTSASSEAKNASCGVFGLVGLHYRSPHRKPFAIPAGVTALRSPRLLKLFYATISPFPHNDSALKPAEEIHGDS